MLKNCSHLEGFYTDNFQVATCTTPRVQFAAFYGTGLSCHPHRSGTLPLKDACFCPINYGIRVMYNWRKINLSNMLGFWPEARGEYVISYLLSLPPHAAIPTYINNTSASN